MVNLKEAVQHDELFPKTICVHMASAERGNDFFDGLWPQALAIGDPKQELYRAFGVSIGSIGQFFKPDIWKAYWANRKFGVGLPAGNTMRNPGAVLVQGKNILHQQSFAHFGEQVDIESIRELLRS